MKIDWWTLGIQTVNVAILIWLLQHFFWRPLAAMIEQRRVAAQSALADAAAKQAAAQTALADIAKTRAGFTQEHDAILAAARTAADAANKESLADTGRAIATLQAASTASIAAAQDADKSAWVSRSSALAVTIAGRLAARLNGPAVQTIFLDWLLTSVRALPQSAREAAGADGVTLVATSATALDPPGEDRARTAIAAAFGATPPIAFKVDPALIAGLELSGPNLSVTNSWRADLAHILEELAHDKR
jgi:F-type H+-transporting ATPase subunit b